ncbi:hypothetical protein, partial [Staphylococcus hominis]|uniref:hypothetical protein n=1 Tax=Staphylococcus hominis TaxID=1290 RepID=UPI00119DC7BE
MCRLFVVYGGILGKELEGEGLDILGIKDMGGLLKGRGAYEVVGELNGGVNLALHLDRHDR